MSPHAGTSRSLLILALVVGLAVGLGSAFLIGRSGGTEEPAGTAASAVPDGDQEATADLPEPDPLTDPAQAIDPEAALRGYLAAEVAGDWERSYAFLTADAREITFPSAALWINAHADFPTITGYRVDDVQLDADTGIATIDTLTGFQPIIDPVLGLVAARGRTTWQLEQADDGTWRVDPQTVANQPLYPDPAGAADAVRRWVDARVACADTSDLEAGLLGSPALARSLCEDDQPSPVEIGPIGRLTDSDDVAALLAQFGPEVFAWAQTARVDATTPLLAVLAPIGTEWRVVATLASRP